MLSKRNMLQRYGQNSQETWHDRSVRLLVAVFIQLSNLKVTLSQGVDFWYQFSIMTARSKFVFQTASPGREQSVQNVVLVPQNPLEQIVVHIFSEFGCCQDVGTAQSRAHTLADNCRRGVHNNCQLLLFSVMSEVVRRTAFDTIIK